MLEIENTSKRWLNNDFSVFNHLGETISPKISSCLASHMTIHERKKFLYLIFVSKDYLQISLRYSCSKNDKNKLFRINFNFKMYDAAHDSANLILLKRRLLYFCIIAFMKKCIFFSSFWRFEMLKVSLFLSFRRSFQFKIRDILTSYAV